jgi:hypothetical protein
VATGSPTGVAVAGSSNTNGGSSSGSHSGLSEGAKIGIACAVPLTVLAILVAYLFGRQRSKRSAAAGAAASVGAAYEKRSDLPPGQQQQMGMPMQQGGVVMGEKVAGAGEMDVKTGAGGMVPMYATPPPMMPAYAAPPQGMMMMPQELPGGEYMVYPQGPVYEAPAGAQTPAVAQAVPHEMPQQNTVYEAPGS